MTVSTQTSKVTFDGDGAVVKFPFPYRIFRETDLEVILRNTSNTEIEQTLNSDYTIPTSGSFEDGCDVVMTTAPGTGESLSIRRVLPITQLTDWIENDPFLASTLENTFDESRMIDQQINEKFDRTLKVPVSDSDPGVELPVASERALKVLGFDAAGDVLMTESGSVAQTDDINDIRGRMRTHNTSGSVHFSDSDSVPLNDLRGRIFSHIASAGIHGADLTSHTTDFTIHYTVETIELDSIGASGHKHHTLEVNRTLKVPLGAPPLSGAGMIWLS